MPEFHNDETLKSVYIIWSFKHTRIYMYTFQIQKIGNKSKYRNYLLISFNIRIESILDFQILIQLPYNSIFSVLSSVAFISSSFTSRRSDTATTYCPQILICSIRKPIDLIFVGKKNVYSQTNSKFSRTNA